MAKSIVRTAACGACVLVFAAMAALAGSQAPAQSAVVYATVGNSLRWSSLDAKTGTLQPTGSIDNLPAEIHYVAMHPNRRTLYVSVTDRAQLNAIHAFAIEAKTGALTRLGERLALPSTLSRAVHITVDRTGTYLLTAHNTTETVAALRLQSDGRLGQLVSQPAIPKLGYLVHQIRIDRSNRWVSVPVRGNDIVGTTPEQMGRLHVFGFNDGVLTRRSTIDYESGSGPRHLDFHPIQPWMYVLTERGNQIVTYSYPVAQDFSPAQPVAQDFSPAQNEGPLKELFRASTLRDPSFTFPPQRAGAIHVHPNGRWLYVTNRNVAPCASSVPCPDREKKPFEKGENNIAVFSIDGRTGEPTLVEHVDSHGFEPRTFTIDPSGTFLIAGNMMNIVRKDANTFVDVQPNLSVFRIGSDGKLTFLRSYDQANAGLLWWVGAYRLR
jgi:6-phosphogluconolactonase